MQNSLPDWFSTVVKIKTDEGQDDQTNKNRLADKSMSNNQIGNETKSSGDSHLDLARESLSKLIDDSRVPDSIRDSLKGEYKEVKGLLEKLEHGHIHIAVFGRVSVGKSSVLNALLGKNIFSTSISAW